MNRRRAAVLSLAILSAIAIGIIGYRSRSGTGMIHDVHSVIASSTPASINPDFEALAARVERAVVNISGEQRNPARFSRSPESLFNRLDAFNLFDSNFDTRWVSLGSGFILSPDGFILTNSHIVENASSIKVELRDRRIMEAVLVGTDPQTDLAVLKIGRANLPSLQLAKADTAAVGEWAAAFGSPSGYERTITAGIICGRGRFPASGLSNSLLQTDAAITPENSGGPLVNLQGEVIGVNLIVEDRSRQFSGLGFAIPSSVAGKAYSQIIQSGRTARGWIGISIQDITPQMARAFSLITHEGVLVSEVASDSPAAKARAETTSRQARWSGIMIGFQCRVERFVSI